MSFLVAAALAVGLLVVVPVVAHLLRRGRAAEQDFPPASLVPREKPIAQQRSRLEDRALLALRGLLIAALAVIGATPLVRCSRLSLARNAGASVALALVIDDSLSMRAEGDDGSRFERARRAALELLGSAREGDAVALVLAGRPARLSLAATTDLLAARRAIGELVATDRATDLADAIQLGRSSIERLPHVDKRVLLLSDLMGAPPAHGTLPVWAPVTELAAPLPDCGVVSAEQLGRRVTVSVACSSAEAARGRNVQIVAANVGVAPGAADAGSAPTPPGPLATAPLLAQAGTQSVDLVRADAEMDRLLRLLDVTDASAALLDAILDGKDALPADDRAPVFEGSHALGVGVVADPATASVTTGGPTVIEQALSALGDDLRVRPLNLTPDEPRELDPLAALVVDDPAGIGPEARAALTAWLEAGGVALALLGPRSEDVQLGSTLEPFVGGRATLERTSSPGADPASIGWLGPEGASLATLGASERVRLGEVDLQAGQVKARWLDGEPLLLSREVGRGLVLTLGLPASVERSDLALRPGFVALLDHALGEARRRRGLRASAVGTPWTFPQDGELSIQGPGGPLSLSAPTPAQARVALPELHGRYFVEFADRAETRVALIDAEEITTPPADFARSADVQLGPGKAEPVDLSPQLAIAVLGLFTAELLFRTLTRVRLSRRARVERRAPRAAG